MKYASLLLFPLLLLPLSANAKKTAPMVTQISRARFEVSRGALEKEIKDPGAELAKFKAMPAGFFTGIRVSDFREGCLLPKFGLKSGDVVEMVNGEPLRTPLDIFEIGQKLAHARPGAKVRVNISRGEEDVVYTYLLVK